MFISRCCTLKIFIDKLVPLIDCADTIRVAVVGGTNNEIELNFFSKSYQVTSFGIDSSDVYLDLNYIANFKHSFDLVICNQVLEHIWDHENAFINLAHLLRKGGLMWITVPCSNFAHASPSYYCAGFNNLYLDQQALKHNFDVITSSSFGALRLYRFQHLINVWPSANEYFSPIIWFF
jgi:SAM-dependent methyltransferase